MPHYNSVEMCALCEAHTRLRPHNNFHADAAWRSTLVSNARFRERLRRPLHPLVDHCLFSKYTYRFDLLHMLDHHGVASHVVGNILWAHLAADRDCNVLPGDNQDERLAFLNSEVKAFYSHAKVTNRMPPLKLSNLKSDAFPELKGNGVKAANTRALVPFVVDIQKRATNMNPSERNKHMLKVVSSLQTAYDIMYGNGFFLSDGALTSLDKALTRMGQHYQWLALNAFDAKKSRWNCVPKLHYAAAHISEQAALINPRLVQGYANESMVGVVCSIYELSQSGPFRARVQHVSMLKYRIGVHLIWNYKNNHYLLLYDCARTHTHTTTTLQIEG